MANELGDNRLEAAGTMAAYVDGALAGFTIATRLADAAGVPWIFLRLGVGERFRRQGVGTALLRRAAERIEAAGPVSEITIGAWLPNDAAERFAEHHRLGFSRLYWRMERALGGVPEPVWPKGIALRTFDGSPRAIEDMTAIYNDSFSDHDHFVPGTTVDTIDVVEADLFRAEGMGLAYRGEECLGFCRCTLYPHLGEISIIGTSKRARGIGLGRALLRWGIRWMEDEGATRIGLIVDGENENALKLYRQEGFEVARTRRRWTKPGSLGA
ncbi:MAG TPA: GNAT family N-acetyltransferase [Candidatus Eisenbacteria bacterium]|nr:GNAT family N-acetyltransferase [Candidatus Eisenbacteria bacterium]